MKLAPSVVASLCCFSIAAATFAAEPKYASHPPQRPLPVVSNRPMDKGPAKFVDVAAATTRLPARRTHRGSRSVTPSGNSAGRHALPPRRNLLRATRSSRSRARPRRRSRSARTPANRSSSTAACVSSTTTRPAVGSPSPAAPKESTSRRRAIQQLNDRRVPDQFLPGSWEPLWGIEDDRPLALGNFADSMVPLHGYRMAVDLRSDSEFWLADKKDESQGGLLRARPVVQSRDGPRPFSPGAQPTCRASAIARIAARPIRAS